MSVYTRVGQLAAPAAFVTWLFRLTRHRAMDHLRQRHRFQVFMDGVAADESALGDYTTTIPEASTPDTDHGFDVTEILTAIEALPAMSREVLTLRFQDDMTYEEISVVTGCSVGTVKSRLHYAKRRLQEALEDRRQ
ncbi:MAG: RNA polymerase sigma factor [Gemmatimonadaceae bacterium]